MLPANWDAGEVGAAWVRLLCQGAGAMRGGVWRVWLLQRQGRPGLPGNPEQFVLPDSESPASRFEETS